MEDEINLIDLWQVVWKYRWMTVLLTMIAVVVTGIVSLNLPKQYKATASVLPQIEMSKVQMAVP
ncbi:MAG TPA: Wzz/FepE/Etk N-terminal domain-containing protein, partial [bacterium]|nr:Wzz/FepE/Etk N-terminal domain-containing protein [bacterium]